MSVSLIIKCPRDYLCHLPGGSVEVEWSGATSSGIRTDWGFSLRSHRGGGGGVAGRNIEHSGALTPRVPLGRQDMQGTGGVTPPRGRWLMYTGGLRALEPQLPPKGTQVAPQISTDAQNREVGLDRQNVVWSPENILVDTVARLQQDVADIRAESRQLRTPGVRPVVYTPRQVEFTTTNLSRFGGITSWEQYQQVFDAIVLSNGWDDATAALQLLSHLEGDALNVALFVPMSPWTSRTGLVDAFVGTLWVAGQIGGL